MRNQDGEQEGVSFMNIEKKMNEQDDSVSNIALFLSSLRNPSTALALGIFIGSISLPACISYSVEAITGNLHRDVSAAFFSSDTVALWLGFAMCCVVLCAEALDSIGRHCVIGKDLSAQAKTCRRVILLMLVASSFSSLFCAATSFLCFYDSRWFCIAVVAVLVLTLTSLVARSNSFTKEKELARRLGGKDEIRTVFGSITTWAILTAASVFAPPMIIIFLNFEKEISMIIFYITLILNLMILSTGFIMGLQQRKRSIDTRSYSADSRSDSHASSNEISVAFKMESSAPLDCAFQISIRNDALCSAVARRDAMEEKAANGGNGSEGSSVI